MQDWTGSILLLESHRVCRLNNRFASITTALGFNCFFQLVIEALYIINMKTFWGGGRRQ